MGRLLHPDKGRIGLGFITCDRTQFFSEVCNTAKRVLKDHVDEWTVYDDGISGGPCPHKGVAYAKNQVLKTLLDRGCEWIFVSEDDVIVQSSEAIMGYIRACENTGLEHLSFAHHGPANVDKTPTYIGDEVACWEDYVGAWCVYSRTSLLTSGLMDENFYNAWEHVEHTLRLAQNGFTTPWRQAADAKGSENWLHEIPGSIINSVISTRPDWQNNIERGRKYWLQTKPETARLIWSEG